MKNNKLIIVLVLLCLVVGCLCACEPQEQPDEPVPFVEKDYVSELKLDLNSSTKKAEATVRSYIDGDTTHFYVDDRTIPDGVLKARYLAVDTPESTSQIEEYGKQAANFTKDKLKSAAKIMLESNTEEWNVDSTGSRYLVFIWYKTSEDADWRNLNLELLQNGYAFAKNTLGNIYGETCMAALDQAKTLKLKVYSGEPDPLFYYGSAQYVSLKTLRCKVEELYLQKVAFEGVVTRYNSDGVYVENYDVETDMYFGIFVYYGNGAKPDVISALNIGNYVRVVGTVNIHYGNYQVSGVVASEDGFKTEVLQPDDNILANFEVIEDDPYSEAGYYVYQPNTELSATEFLTGTKDIDFTVFEQNADGETEEKIETKNYKFAQLILGTTVTLKDALVTKVYTTEKSGAMTLTCYCEGQTITIRTEVLKDSDGNIITESYFKNKIITVVGIAEWYQADEDDPDTGSYQIKVLDFTDITIQ